jgi:hypothetical protein
MKLENLGLFRLGLPQITLGTTSQTSIISVSYINLRLHNLDFFSFSIEPTMHGVWEKLQNIVFAELLAKLNKVRIIITAQTEQS